MDLRPVFRNSENVLLEWNVDITILRKNDAPLDIWIRDWGFVEGVFSLCPRLRKRTIQPSSDRSCT